MHKANLSSFHVSVTPTDVQMIHATFGVKPLRIRSRVSEGIRSLPRSSVATSVTWKELLDRIKSIEHPDAFREHVDTLQFCCTNDNVDELKGSVKIKKQWGLPVLNPQGNVVGVVTKHDLHTKEGIFVEDVMSSPPVAAHADDTLSWAISLMDKYSVERLPVITSGDGRCVGMICRYDIECMILRGNKNMVSRGAMAGTFEGAMRHHNIDI
jgi:CBS domain-containing protein